MAKLDKRFEDLYRGGVQLKPVNWCDLLIAAQECGLTGLLRPAKDRPGRVYFEDGAIVHAAYDEEKGLPGLVQCIVRARGKWVIQDSDETPKNNVDRDMASIIEGVRKVLNSYGLIPDEPKKPVSLLDDETGAHDMLQTTNAFNSTQVVRSFHPPTIGTMLGRCELVSELGRGATSVVYKARHKSLDIDVAVKVLLPDSDDDDTARMSAKEARLLARLSHQSILRVLDFEQEGSWPYLVIEYVDGQELADVIKEKGRMTESDILPILYQVVSGLAYAYDSEGVIHCDLKPGNVLLTKQGQAKIADLGLARVTKRTGMINAEATIMQTAKGIAGTPAYISPEQVESEGEDADHRSDMYALGAMLYHALAGRPPYEHDNPVQQMFMHVQGGYTPIEALLPKVDPDVADMLHVLLARNPDDRYQNYEELMEILGSLANGANRGDSRYKAGRRTSLFQSLLTKFMNK